LVERSYDKFIDRYMNYRYLRRIPDDRFRQAAVELSKGIMEFNSFHVLPLLPDERVVLLTAGMDTLVPQSLYQEFWFRIPEAKKQAWVHFTNGEHLILEQAPDAVADYLSRALSNDLVGHHRVALKATRDRSFQI
jgi:hypothetical protein